MEIHNARLYDELGIKKPAHIREDSPAKRFGSNFHEIYGGKTLQEAIDNRLKEYKITPRKNSAVVQEYVVGLVGSASELEQVYSLYSAQNFLQKILGNDFIGKRYGMENVVSISLHFDETTPHAHVVVLPIVEKEVRWKNQKGEGVRKEHRLCANDLTGHKDKLRELQTDIYTHIDKFLERFKNSTILKTGEDFSVKVYRGTQRKQWFDNYTKETKYELGILRAELDSCKDAARAKAIEQEIEAKKRDFGQKQGETFRGEKIHYKKLGENDKWKKGKDFEIGF
jgi:hypothetical protein